MIIALKILWHTIVLIFDLCLIAIQVPFRFIYYVYLAYTEYKDVNIEQEIESEVD